MDQATYASLRSTTAPKTSRSAFAATFDGQEPDQDDSLDGQEDESANKPQSRGNSQSPRKRASIQSRQQGPNKKQQGCPFCGGNHRSKSCFLANDYTPAGKTIPSEQKQVFEENMKDRAFAQVIQKHREASKAQYEARKAHRAFRKDKQ